MFSEQLQFWSRITAALISFALLLHVGERVIPEVYRPGHVVGWEADWIAHSIASGHGFSFPSDHRWLFAEADAGNFSSTAWVDPIYTYTLAFLIMIFGSHYEVAAVFLNLVLLAVVFAFIYLTAEAWISPAAGVLAIAVLDWSAGFVRACGELNNTVLATVLLSGSMLAAVNLSTKPGLRASAVLGAILGVAALGCPSSLLFAPGAAVAMLAFRGNKDFVTELKRAAVMCIATSLVLAPWAIRNFVTFGEFVPVRDGGGLLSFVGVVGIAGTLAPETLPTKAAPNWRANTPREAIGRTQDRNARRELENDFPAAYANERDPVDYARANEARRDKWLFGQAAKFTVAHPRLFASEVLPKLMLFAKSLGGLGVLVLALGVAGVVTGFNDPRARTLGVWLALFIAPFGIMICYFDRYREPIEPITTMLALRAIWVIGAFVAKHKSSWHSSRAR